MEIFFNVNNLNIIYESLVNMVGDSVNYITARFSFTGNMWNLNTTKTAIFKCNGLAYSVILTDNACIIPTEVLRGREFSVGVCGSYFEDGLEKTVYTNEVNVGTDRSCFAHNFANGVTPEQYEQLINYVKELYYNRDDPETNNSGCIKANRYTNVLVPKIAFIKDDTFEDYPYKADIYIESVTENDYANISFALTEVKSKNYAPICTTAEGVVSIYSVNIPSADITIPLIEVVKV